MIALAALILVLFLIFWLDRRYRQICREDSARREAMRSASSGHYSGRTRL